MKFGESTEHDGRKIWLVESDSNTCCDKCVFDGTARCPRGEHSIMLCVGAMKDDDYGFFVDSEEAYLTHRLIRS